MEKPPSQKTTLTMKTYTWNNHAHGKLRKNYHTKDTYLSKSTLRKTPSCKNRVKFPNVRHACRFNFIHEFTCKFCVVFSSRSRVRCTHLILYCNDETCVIMMEHTC
jgi:hypothetical protein